MRVTLLNDTLVESNEAFSLSIVSATRGGVPVAVTTASAGMTIIDNDAA